MIDYNGSSSREETVPSLTIENYVKAIYTLSATADKAAATGAIAEALEVSPGSVTSMLKSLAEAGLVEYVPYEGARLTSQGRALALRVVRRHRLIELFLVQTLGFSWDEVHDEAEHLEHAMSDTLVDRIDVFLGHPANDPHGDPIPKADGTIDLRDGRQLCDVAAGSRFRLIRVRDQSADFLRYLSDAGLHVGIAGMVSAPQPTTEIVTISVDGRSLALSRVVAEKLLVECE